VVYSGSAYCQLRCIENYPVLKETTALRHKLIVLEKSQVGVKELTGNNDGKEVEMYLRSVGLKKGNAYCAAGQAWCHITLNIPNPESGFSPDWFKTNVVYIKGQPRNEPHHVRGGEVTGYWVPAKKRIGHVGCAIYEERLDVYVVEFNSSNRVRYFIRRKSDIDIMADFVGYNEILKAMKK
jgi:hypothetical protein